MNNIHCPHGAPSVIKHPFFAVAQIRPHGRRVLEVRHNVGHDGLRVVAMLRDCAESDGVQLRRGENVEFFYVGFESEVNSVDYGGDEDRRAQAGEIYHV